MRRDWWGTTMLAGLLALAGACSSSKSETKPDAATCPTGAAATTRAAAAGPCDPRTTYTEAAHLIANVSWPAGTASMKGDGQLHVWGKVAYTASGNTLTGMLQPCGIALPPTTLTALGGGGMIQIEVPNESWDAPSIPRFQVDGTQTSWDTGATVNLNYAALIGFTMTDGSTAPWPTSYSDITMTSDVEGDTHPGLTAVPRSGGTYTLPPTSILQSARADQLYIVIRQVTSAALTRTTCDEASGGATFMHLDNHVIGCHVMGGDDCMPNDVNFIDTNRTIYEITCAVAETKVVADTATCADVRAALPM